MSDDHAPSLQKGVSGGNVARFGIGVDDERDVNCTKGVVVVRQVDRRGNAVVDLGPGQGIWESHTLRAVG